MKLPVAIVNNDYDEHLSIDFAISNVCNFKCHYCHPGSNEGDKKFPVDYKLIIKNFDHLLNVYKNYFNKTNIKIEITGGEPTLWPQLGDFAKHLKQVHNITNIALTTNGSRTIRWWKENSKYFDEVHLSLHPEEGSVDHLIDIADHIFNETDSHVAVNVIMDPNDWSKSKFNLEKVVAWNTPWLVKTWILIKNGSIMNYNEEQLKILEKKVYKKPPDEYISRMLEKQIISNRSAAKVVYDDGTIESYNSFELRNNQTHNFSGWLCNLGVDRIPIIFGQLMGSCGATNIFNLEKPLSIYDKDFIDRFQVDIIKPITCRQMSCGSCTKDLKIPKAKIHNKRSVISINHV